MDETRIEDIPAGAVVVGIDGSEDSRTGLAWAVDHARRVRRPLVLLHAADGAAVFSRVYVDGVGADLVGMVGEAVAAGHRLCAEAAERVEPHGLEVTHVVSREDPRHALLAASRRASLIVLGSRGRGPVASLLLGSVGVAVGRHADCPVVVVRPGTTPAPHAPVVVGVDATPASRGVLEFASAHASAHELPVTVLHTHADQFALAYGLPSMSEVRDVEDAALELAEAIAGFGEKYPDTAATRVLRGELTLDALLHLGRGASLVVVGRHHPPGLRGALAHGTAAALMERAHTPVAVVPVR